MANAKDIAGLAALAGLAYMNRDKLGFGDKGGLDREEQTGKLARNYRGAGYNSTETRPDANPNVSTVTDTGDETDRLLARSPAPDYSNEGRNSVPVLSNKQKSFTDNSSNQKAQTQVYKASTPKVVSEPTDKSVTLSPDAALKETNMTRSSRSVANDNYSNEARSQMDSAKKNQIPVLPLGSSDKKTYERKERATAAAIKSYADQQAEKARINKLRASGGRRATGGAIKTTKMASGGITSSASRRADGIASKGKTRGKIC